jgi:RES domain-containing protein
LKIYRVTTSAYKDDLSGEGARLYGGRWNLPGDAMVYFSNNLSLCVLEILVHLEFKILTNEYYFIEAEIDDSLLLELANPNFVDTNWGAMRLHKSTQRYGSNWIDSQKSLGLSVPSAVLPQERNILINPKHIDFAKLKIIRTISLDVDGRLFD